MFVALGYCWRYCWRSEGIGGSYDVLQTTMLFVRERFANVPGVVETEALTDLVHCDIARGHLGSALMHADVAIHLHN